MDKVVPSEAGTVKSLKTVNEAGRLAQFGGEVDVCIDVLRAALIYFFIFIIIFFLVGGVFFGLGFLSPYHPHTHLYFDVIFYLWRFFVFVSSFVVSPCSSVVFRLNSIVMEEGCLCNY